MNNNIDISKRTKGVYFWSDNYLMQNNDNGTFSSSHILELGNIELDESMKHFILSALNNYDKLVEALKNIVEYPNSCTEDTAEVNLIDIVKAQQLLKSIEEDI